MSALPIRKNNPEPQPYFGLHKLNGLWYLFQDTMPEGVAISAPDQSFEHYSGVNTDFANIGGACTHNINPFVMFRRLPKCQWGKFLELIKDPLAQVFLPAPNIAKNNVFILDSTFNPSWFFLLKTLERLCSPLHSKIDKWDVNYQNKRLSDLYLSNIQPQVYTVSEADIQDLHYFHEFITAAHLSKLKRPVLLVGNTQVCKVLKSHFEPDITEIETELRSKSLVANIMHFPLEHMGSRVLYHYCSTGHLRVV